MCNNYDKTMHVNVTVSVTVICRGCDFRLYCRAHSVVVQQVWMLAVMLRLLTYQLVQSAQEVIMKQSLSLISHHPLVRRHCEQKFYRHTESFEMFVIVRDVGFER